MAYRCQERNMAARIRDDSWIEDRKLKEELRKYVGQGLRREEILDYMKRDSLSTCGAIVRLIDASVPSSFILWTERSVWNKCKLQYKRNSMVPANYWDIELCKTN